MLEHLRSMIYAWCSFFLLVLEDGHVRDFLACFMGPTQVLIQDPRPDQGDQTKGEVKMGRPSTEDGVLEEITK